MTNPVKWVRWDSDVFNSHKWLATPMDERGVWSHIVLLAGLSDQRGTVKASAEEMALVFRCDPELVARTLERFRGYGAIKRTRGMWVVINFDRYNPPNKYLTASQRHPAGDNRHPQGDERHPEGDERVATYVTVRDETNGTNVEAALGVLAGVAGYDLDEEKDRAFLEELRVEYPSLPLLREIRKWATYKLDHPITAKSSPRSQMRTWFDKAVAFAARDAAKTSHVPARIPTLEEQIAAQDAR